MEWIALKSGWLYERRNGLVLGARWTPRYVVLYSEPVPALGVYEQRSDAAPPYAPLRHVDLLPDTQIAGGSQDGRSESRRGSLLGWLKKGSLESRLEKPDQSMIHLNQGPERASEEQGSVGKVFTVMRPKNGKLCFAAKNRQECDEWVQTLCSLMEKSNVPARAEASPFTPIGEQRAEHLPSTPPARPHVADAETISCGGILVLDGKTVARIRTMGFASGRLSGDLSSSSSDSIVGNVTSSMAILSDDPIDQLDELSFKYLQGLIDRSKTDNPRDILRLDLHLSKLVGTFHGRAWKSFRSLIDEYHHKGPSRQLQQPQATHIQEGPMKILLIADYSQANDEIVEGANSWLRQEMNAARWISSHGRALMQPLMTVMEYKGFRALAIMSLPLNERSLVMEAQTGLIEEAAQTLTLELGRAMNLAPFLLNQRGPEGRTMQRQLVLPPSLEVHRLSTKRSKERATEKPLSGNTGMTATTPAGIYLANVHDVIPNFPQSDDSQGRESFLYFRPELIQVLPCPFNPTSDGAAALKVLRDQRLPLLLGHMEDLMVLPLDSEDWRHEMHRHGLNMAFLGIIAQGTQLPHVRDGAVTEMVARAAKTTLRGRLRGAILHFRDVQALRVEEELVALSLDLLNRVLSGEECGIVEEIIGIVEDKFGFHVKAHDLCHFSRNSMLMALQHHCALLLKDSAFTHEGPVLLDEFVGFSVRITNGGTGAFHVSTKEKTSLEDFSQILLPVSEMLGGFEERRAAASKAALKLSKEHKEDAKWGEALKWAEIAAGLAPRHHPIQALIRIMFVGLKLGGPPALPVRSPTLLLEHEKGLSRLEEVERVKLTVLKMVGRHFGSHHPLGIQVRVELADIFAAVHDGGPKEAIALRREALEISRKVLGRRHKYSLQLLEELAEALRVAANYDESITTYLEAIKQRNELNPVPGADETRERLASAVLAKGLALCWEKKGEYETALEWAEKCLGYIEKDARVSSDEEVETTFKKLWEGTLEMIAILSQLIFASNISNDANTKSRDLSYSLKDLIVDEMLTEQLATHLTTAAISYERLFDARRKRDLSPLDGEALLHLARRIIHLELRLATPSQRPLLRTALRRKLYAAQDPNNVTRDTAVRELLVRLVAGPVTPRDMVKKVLARAQAVETLPEAESELSLLLDLVELAS